MLKNIRLHIEKDEEKQAELDNTLANQILTTQKSNINAFQRNIPSLLPLIKGLGLSNYSVFINKFGEPNIVDYGLGRTFYGFHPKEEVLQQLAQYQSHTPEILLTKDTTKPSDEFSQQSATISLNALSSFRNYQAQKPLPKEIECLVVLGCGLGLHILPLLEQHKIKNLIIYEPEPQFFQCSMMVTHWQDIFAQAKAYDTAIFLQLEKDSRDVIDDIKQLAEHTSISSFHLYKHYNHQVFESVFNNFCNRSWEDINQGGLSIKTVDSHLEYTPQWTPNIKLSNYSIVGSPDDKLSRNLDALKSFFPDIYEQYKDYTPQKWQPIANPSGEVNLVKIDSLHAWYSEHPKQDCILNFENFNEQPNKDGLVLGYSGTKLAHYIHYQFVKETEELLKQSEEEVGALPDNVASIIMFGLGVGYQLEKLLSDHTVEKLFICEPNPDFFYASLFAIDWQTIFETIDESDSRIYLNIGDDGTNLFQDLLSQFHSIGPYILNSTYFYQSYYNASLNTAISQLREQLQVVISMGEYFDHAYYGIEHTKEGMKRKIPVLSANPSSKLSYDDKEVPIFIVGNGPSLDNSIDAIKEWKEQAIVVSCGTALQALHRHGITPDFHTEIEQNRSTFDWAVLIGDLDYLKRITLISCNGIHPDTCDLYKDVLVVFKEGESSTISALNILGRENFEVLQNAYPTVSNFVCDLFSTLGFSSIYLLGVDLGFVDANHHHSKSSGYYKESGNETYDYSKTVNTSLIVPGNFRSKVNTKHEFKVSKQVIEQVTLKKRKEQAFYNCSDGAKIEGTMPTRPDDLLIVATANQKEQAARSIKQGAFSNNNIKSFIEKFENKYSYSTLIKELEAFESLIENNDIQADGPDHIINRQKEMLFESYKKEKSLLFYYLYGTVNYANAVLTKLANGQLDDTSKACIQAKEEWLTTIKHIKKALLNDTAEDFDTSYFRALFRARKYLELKYRGEKLAVVTNSNSFKSIIQHIIREYFFWLKEVTVLTPDESLSYEGKVEHLIYFLNEPQSHSWITGKNSTLVITKDISEYKETDSNISFLYIPKLNEKTTVTNEFITAATALECCLCCHNGSLLIPKFFVSPDGLDNTPFTLPIYDYHAFEYLNYLCISPNKSTQEGALVSMTGSRRRALSGKLKANHLIQEVISNEVIADTQRNYSDLIKSLV
jgi:hypothetical protein